MVARFLALAGLLAFMALGCKWIPFAPPGDEQQVCAPVEPDSGTPTVSMNFGGVAGGDFFAAPFPAMGRDGDPTGSDGSQFPASTPLAYRVRDLVSTDGYAVSAGIFFELSDAVDPQRLPNFVASTVTDGGTESAAGLVTAGAIWTDGGTGLPAVLLFPLDDPGNPAAIRVGQTQSGHVLLNVLPLQGRPLRENADYVAIVTRTLGNRDGVTMDTLCQAAMSDAGNQPLPQIGLDRAADVDKYIMAIQAAGRIPVACDDIAAMSVFHTSDPTAAMRAAQDLAHDDYQRAQGGCGGVGMRRDTTGPDERCPKAPFCVFVGQVNLPQYQRGAPPYLPYVQWGGGWPSSPVPAPAGGPAGCQPVAQVAAPADPDSWTPTWRTARVVVTIPHAPPPPGGYPTIVLVRAGAGGVTDPIVDRGPTLAPPCNQTACRGPAEVFQSAGFAGITIDGPLTGESRLDPGFGGNEDFNIYNFLNPIALRDNLRQSALELTLVPDILGQLQIDLGACEEAGQGSATFDLGHLAMFSHSMGSSIAPLALAGDARYRLAILSGSGGSNIENVVYKAAPIPIYVGGALLGLPGNCQVDEFPTGLSLLQWGTEPSDSQVYARRMVFDAAPPGATWWAPSARSILMIQGMVDHDILPPIADVMTLGDGLDLGLGPNSCFGSPVCDTLAVNGEVASMGYPSIADLLPLSGRSFRDLSEVTGNVPWPARVPRPPHVTGDLTAVVVQHRIDENREPLGQNCQVDGHEAIFESTLARHQYGCFLNDFAHDRTPQVRAAGEELAPCDP